LIEIRAGTRFEISVQPILITDKPGNPDSESVAMIVGMMAFDGPPGRANLEANLSEASCR